ncbi:hypothetical protein IGS68_12925 [Skermanella sp. TT6]|uniref:Uncharacterized protein n=1 Tax=Skermanella cutis TaxID=2775420 RepID=A0ABX7BD22_9PROT|nr:hypothetical protein [Skermanella sp. TT6]QQP92044.1 hypothetical protein IGS68_12925 [Skermanella sp. TT6]
MSSMNVTQHTHVGFFHAARRMLANTVAGWLHRAEARLEQRRLQAELDSLSRRDRQDIDVTSGNLSWAAAALEGRHGLRVQTGGLNSVGALRGNIGN